MEASLEGSGDLWGKSATRPHMPSARNRLRWPYTYTISIQSGPTEKSVKVGSDETSIPVRFKSSRIPGLVRLSTNISVQWVGI